MNQLSEDVVAAVAALKVQDALNEAVRATLTRVIFEDHRYDHHFTNQLVDRLWPEIQRRLDIYLSQEIRLTRKGQQAPW
jgi:hypothetical protein